jgi:uncharacterized protein YbjQ (UPF0145 family)
MKKNSLTLRTVAAVAVTAAVTLVTVTQAGCATQVKSLPLAPVPAVASQGTDVALYFGAQDHPAVQRQLGRVSYSVRIARTTDGPEASCNKALAQALQKVRTDAREHGANAVVNVKTRFHSTETASATNYTCGVSPSAAAIAVEGERVVLQTN